MRYTELLFEILKGGRHKEDLGVDGRTILNWLLEKQCWRMGLD
jgi:hypothetical protein